MPDQTLTGVSTIASAQSFSTVDSHLIQTLIAGNTTIPSAEYFEPPSGVSIDPLSVPTALYLSY